MWFFKLLFLLSLIASWLPIESKADDLSSQGTSIDFESDDGQEEEQEEEEVVV